MQKDIVKFYSRRLTIYPTTTLSQKTGECYYIILDKEIPEQDPLFQSIQVDVIAIERLKNDFLKHHKGNNLYEAKLDTLIDIMN